MNRKAWVCILGGIAGTSVLLLAGCAGGGDTRLTNQGGGSLLSAGAKVAGSRAASLNPDEIQILSDTFAAEGTPQMTDEQAAGISEFLVANSINSVADVEQLLADLQSDPTSITVPDGFFELFTSVDLSAFGT